MAKCLEKVAKKTAVITLFLYVTLPMYYYKLTNEGFACSSIQNGVSTPHGEAQWDIAKPANKCLHLIPKMIEGEDKGENQVVFQPDIVWVEDWIKAGGTSEDREICQHNLCRFVVKCCGPQRTCSRSEYLSNSS